jgi:hypothetical protein
VKEIQKHCLSDECKDCTKYQALRDLHDRRDKEAQYNHLAPRKKRKRSQEPDLDSDAKPAEESESSVGEVSTEESDKWDDSKNDESEVDSDEEDVAWLLAQMTVKDILDQAHEVSLSSVVVIFLFILMLSFTGPYVD